MSRFTTSAGMLIQVLRFFAFGCKLQDGCFEGNRCHDSKVYFSEFLKNIRRTLLFRNNEAFAGTEAAIENHVHLVHAGRKINPVIHRNNLQACRHGE